VKYSGRGSVEVAVGIVLGIKRERRGEGEHCKSNHMKIKI
jgi:hypothetical protein